MVQTLYFFQDKSHGSNSAGSSVILKTIGVVEFSYRNLLLILIDSRTMSTWWSYLRLHSTSSVTRREWPGENLPFCGQTNQSCVGGASTKRIHTCNTHRKRIHSLEMSRKSLWNQNMSTQIASSTSTGAALAWIYLLAFGLWNFGTLELHICSWVSFKHSQQAVWHFKRVCTFKKSQLKIQECKGATC